MHRCWTSWKIGGGVPEFFDGFPDGLKLCSAVEGSIRDSGDASVHVTKSQIAFRRRKAFAHLCRPGQYVNSTGPAVVSIVLPDEVESDRIESVAPLPRVWMHHIELHDVNEINDEVRDWRPSWLTDGKLR